MPYLRQRVVLESSVGLTFDLDLAFSAQLQEQAQVKL